MKLGDYLKAQKISDDTFAAEIGLSRQSVRKYRLGETVPRPGHMDKITKASRGMVTREDWAEVAADRVRAAT